MVSPYFAKAYVYFRNADGGNFRLTPGQEELFRIIYEPSILRGAVRTYTQFGKSEVASLALNLACVERREKVLVVAPSDKQSSIIMGKVIDHLFDHSLLTGMIDYSAVALEKLKQERSKGRITFKNGSEIMKLTAEAKYVAQEAKNLMGFGASLVLVDESPLIPDVMFTKILRMIGGEEHGKLIQLGNAFEDNHFARAFESKRYVKLAVDWRQGLAEGRVTQEFLDEAREVMSPVDWSILYECRFPEMGAENAMIPRDWIALAINQGGCGGEFKQAGLDVARFGRDSTVYILRQGGEVKRIERTEKMGTMEVVGWVRSFLSNDKPDVLCTDVIGIGSGVHDRLEEVQEGTEWENTELVPVNVGAGPTDEGKDKYFNLRAQVFDNLSKWFKPDDSGRSRISIPDDPALRKGLEELRYSYSSERKKKVEAKDKMKERLGRSPDECDALSLAFFEATEQAEMMVM